MRTVGIIAEYNPFHTGHAYHIARAKQLARADYAVVAMSPDFVQRGEPALFDKYARARMALQNGADAVLELPVCYACASAEYFARGAASLLNSLGVVDALCFGGESDDVQQFLRAAELLLREPDDFSETLKSLLRQGKTYPQARSEALGAYVSPGFLASPNNILGVEYCKALLALESKITPLPLRRAGNSYHSGALTGAYCSASALRRAVFELHSSQSAGGDASALHSSQGTTVDAAWGLHSSQSAGGDASALHLSQESAEYASILSYVPENCRDAFLAHCRSPHSADELLPLLLVRLLENERFDHILDIGPELSDRIRALRYSCIGASFEETAALLKTKQLTHARIRRALLHLILNIRADDTARFLAGGTVYYARLLGFRRDSSPLLRRMQETSRIPLITKTADAPKRLGGDGLRMWEQDVRASHLYRGLKRTEEAPQTFRGSFRTEYEISPVIL